MACKAWFWKVGICWDSWDPHFSVVFRFAPLNKHSMTHGFPWTAPRQRLQAPKTKRYISCTSQNFIQFINWAFPMFSAKIQLEIQQETSFQRKFIRICTFFFQVLWSAGATGAVRAIWTATRGWPGTEIPGKLWETHGFEWKLHRKNWWFGRMFDKKTRVWQIFGQETQEREF